MILFNSRVFHIYSIRSQTVIETSNVEFDDFKDFTVTSMEYDIEQLTTIEEEDDVRTVATNSIATQSNATKTGATDDQMSDEESYDET